MVVKAEQERVKALIADTVSLLCKNGLNYTKEFCIEGLLGITLDQDEVFLVNIKEIVKTELGAKEDESDSGSGSAGEDGEKTKPQKRKKRKRRRSSRASNNESDNEETNSSMAQANNSDNGEPANKSIKQELEDDSGDDLVFVKDEPSANNSFGQTSFSQSQFPSADNSNILGNLSQHGQLYATPQSDPLPGPSWDPNVSQAAMFNTSQQQHLASQQQPGANASSQAPWLPSPRGSCVRDRESLVLRSLMVIKGPLVYPRDIQRHTANYKLTSSFIKDVVERCDLTYVRLYPSVPRGFKSKLVVFKRVPSSVPRDHALLTSTQVTHTAYSANFYNASRLSREELTAVLAEHPQAGALETASFHGYAWGWGPGQEGRRLMI